MSSAAATPAADAVLAGDRRALGQLITAVENDDPSAAASLRALFPHTGKAVVIGIAGPLGVGKSSLINRLLQHLRGQGKRVGVVAVDPSSPFSGGSVLGDRVRLDRRPGDDGVFIRSMASRGHSGGISRAAREVTRLLDAFGCDVILLETVGSGQVDVEVREVATTTVVVVVPHLGDEVQSLKAGLFEIADVFCVNKSDLPGADLAVKNLRELASLSEGRDGWRPRVVSASAAEDRGISELWDEISAHETFRQESGLASREIRIRVARELAARVADRIGRDLEQDLAADPGLAKLVDDVIARRTDPRDAADRLLQRWAR